MTELELALKNHDWSLAGFAGRVLVDQLMKQHPAEASALWENTALGATATAVILFGANNESLYQQVSRSLDLTLHHVGLHVLLD